MRMNNFQETMQKESNELLRSTTEWREITDKDIGNMRESMKGDQLVNIYPFFFCRLCRTVLKRSNYPTLPNKTTAKKRLTRKRQTAISTVKTLTMKKRSLFFGVDLHSIRFLSVFVRFFIHEKVRFFSSVFL